MSNSVDKRVVEMRFDNQQFESRASTTMGTLEKLKKALTFKDASSGLDDLDRKVKNVSMNPLAAGVEAVQMKFSALQAAAFTALQNIVNRAVDAGINIAKSLSIDQISAGFSEYELKMGSIQTIMASTGESLDTVNGYLEELNHYADKTIYSFSDMTSNIGKFTNAGVKLDAAVSAIQGVSNVAAISGANANEASRAMYNFAQALSAGYVKLIDWKSIENANMATVEFKEQLIQTALAMGTLVEKGDRYVSTTTDANGAISDAFDATHMFNDSLSAQWMTTDVLVQALNNYSTDIRTMSEEEVKAYEEKLKSIGYTEEQIKKIEELGQKAFDSAQDVKTFSQLMDTLKESVGSGWAQTFELIFGDFEEAKRRWTIVNEEIGGIIQRSTDARNALLEKALGIPDKYIDKSLSTWDTLAEKIEAAGVPVDDFIEKCKDIGDEMGLIDKSAIQTFDDFKESLASGWLSGDLIAQAIDSFIGPLGTVDQAVSDASHSFERFKEIVNETIQGSWSTGQDRMNKFAEAGWNAAAMQEAVNKVYYGGELAMQDYEAALGSMTDAQLQAAGYTDEQIEALRALQEEYKALGESVDGTAGSVEKVKTGSELLLESIANLWAGVKGIFKGLKDGWEMAFPSMTADRLYDILKAFNELTAKFRDWVGNSEDTRRNPMSSTVRNIRDSFSGFASIIGLVLDVLKETSKFLVETFGSSVGNAVDKVLAFTANVGSLIRRFRDWVSENNIIRTGLETIYTLLSPVIELFNRLGSIVWDTMTTLLSMFSSPIRIGGLESGASFVEKLSLFLDGLKSSAASARESISLFFDRLHDDINGSTIMSSIKDLWNGLRSLLTGMASGLGNFVEKLIGAFGDGGLGGLLGILGTISFSGLISAVKKLAGSISGPLSGIKELFGNVSGILSGVKDSLVSWQESLKASTLLKIAIAVGILAAALFTIASIDGDKLSSALAAITVLFIDLTGSMALFSKFSSSMKGASKATGMMIGLSISVLLLASALKKVSSLSLSELGVGLLGVAGLMTEMVLSMKVLSSGSKHVGKGAAAMIAFSIAIRVIIPAFQILSGMDWEQLGKGLVGLGGIMAEFAIGMRAMKGTLGGSASLLIAASSLLVLLPVLVVLGNMKSEEISSALIMIGGALVELSIALNLMKGTLGGSAALLVAATALLIMTPVLVAIGQLKMEQITNSLAILGGALLELSIALNLMKGTLGGSASLLVASAAILVLTPALMALGQLDMKQIGSALLALGGAFAVIGVAGLLLKPLLPTILGLSAAFLLFSVSVTAVGAGIALLGVGISAIVAAFASLVTVGTVGATAIVSALSVIISGIAALIPEVAAQIGNGIIAISKVIQEGAPEIAAAIKAIVSNLIDVLIECVPQLVEGAFQLITSVLEKLDDYGPQITAMLIQFIIDLLNSVADNMPQLITSAMNIIGSFFAGVLNALSTINPDTLISALKGIGLLTGIIAALGLVAPLMPAAMAGVLGMGVILVELGAVMGLIGTLASDKVMDAVDKAIDFAYKVGEFFGALIGGFAAGVSSGLADIGSNLSAFSTNAQPFIDSMSALGTDTSAIEGIKAFGAALLELTASDLINTISKFFGGGVANFGTELQSFGEAMVGFSDTVSGNIDEGAVTAAATAGTALAELEDSIPKTGGWVQSILGEADMEKFGTGISAFAQAIIDFNDLVVPTNIDQTKIEAASAAGMALSGLQDSIPKTGGVWQNIAGESDMEKFSTGIITFGEAIVGYSEVVGAATFDTAIISASVEAGMALSGLQDSIPKTGGWVQSILGESDMKKFAASVTAFGTAMSSYAASISGLNEDDITASVAAAGMLVELQNSLDPEGGVFDNIKELFTGEQSLEKLGAKFVTFGEKMKEYGDNIKGFSDSSATDTVVNTANSLLTMVEQLRENPVGDELSTFADSIISFGTNMASFYGSILVINPDILTGVIDEVARLSELMTGLSGFDSTGISNFVSSLKTLAEDGIDEFCSAFENSTDRVSSAVEALTGAIEEAIANTNTDLTEVGTESATSYLDGVASVESDASTAGETLSNQVLDKLDSAITTFETVGKDSATGYVKNIQNQTNSAKTAGGVLAKSILTALSDRAKDFMTAGQDVAKKYLSGISESTNEATKAASTLRSNAVGALKDSRDAYNAGSNVGQGFVNGMAGWSKSAYNAAYKIGRQAITGLQRAIDAHSPSREAEALADYTGLGYVGQLLKYQQEAYSAGEDVGVATLTGLRDVLSNKIAAVLNDEVMNPVITPVVDLSNVMKSADLVNGLFAESIDSTMYEAQKTSIAVATAKSSHFGSEDTTKVGSQQSEDQTPNVFYNTFNITSNNPEEVAQYVTHQIRLEMNRRGSQWA